MVLIFFPWAFTGTCTGELGVVRDRLSDFVNDDTITLAVSCDSVFAQRVFAEREGYTFPLLSDGWPHGAVAQAYGVFVEEKGAAQRGTFVIDKAGRRPLDRRPRDRRGARRRRLRSRRSPRSERGAGPVPSPLRAHSSAG